MSGTREFWQERYDQAAKDGDEFAKRLAESELASIDDIERIQEREKRQKEEVESIPLPRDYDAYYGVQGLNDEIQNLLRQVITTKNEESNQELAGIIESYSGRLQVAETGVAELREHIKETEHAYEVRGETIEALQRSLHEANEAREAAEMKRDNAVAAMEEAQSELDDAKAEIDRLRRSEASLKSQVAELEGMVRKYRANKPAGGIQLTSTLPEMTEEELKAKRERERVESINRNLVRRGIEPLPVPEFPSLPAVDPVPEDVTEEDVQEQMERVSDAAEEYERFPSVVSPESGEEEAGEGTGASREDVRSADTEAAPTFVTLQELAEKVAQLEQRVAEIEEIVA